MFSKLLNFYALGFRLCCFTVIPRQIAINLISFSIGDFTQ